MGSSASSHSTWISQDGLGFHAHCWGILEKPEGSCNCVAVLPEPIGLHSRGHPRSKKGQEKQHVCVPGIVRWVERCPARPEAGPAWNVLVRRCARSCWEAEMSLKCSRQPAPWRSREETFGDPRILLGQEQLILNWPIVSSNFHHSSQAPVHRPLWMDICEALYNF